MPQPFSSGRRSVALALLLCRREREEGAAGMRPGRSERLGTLGARPETRAPTLNEAWFVFKQRVWESLSKRTATVFISFTPFHVVLPLPAKRAFARTRTRPLLCFSFPPPSAPQEGPGEKRTRCHGVLAERAGEDAGIRIRMEMAFAAARETGN
ncbi:hypothetical protein SKAU_G00155070 [Synaphobranchus kaupii]|uniref:Uncharacterized protein n=1 Tax=Synaphobranchus kaupii TaxID=118154 RepID=A0A9Q1IZC1_SYNKA|nr:hypothetical protein SKAU_G00155070 [Synaphobranchus kaupii]